jgi:hypothetical protein
MTDTGFKLISFDEAIAELKRDATFKDRDFSILGGEGGRVRYYERDGVIEGDVNLDALFYAQGIVGIFARQDLQVTGSILNWEIDTDACFLAIGRDLACVNLIAGSAGIRVGRNLNASGIVVSTYNHGYLDVVGACTATYLIVDDHETVVEAEVNAKGWKSSDSDFDWRDSTWRHEVRPEFRDEFFDAEGYQKCPNGNVDLVKALLEGRQILRD